EATRIASVKSMQVPTKGGSWLAYLKEAKAEEKKPAADEDKKAGEKPAEKAEKPAEEPREARAGGPRGRGGARKEYGTDLVLRDLTRGEAGERVFPSTTEYAIARDGKTLLYAVSARKEEQNGV